MKFVKKMLATLVARADDCLSGITKGRLLPQIFSGGYYHEIC